MKKSNTFCPLPWNSLSIRNNGDFRLCCNANSYTKNKGIIRKDDGTPFNAEKDDWEDVRNSELIQDVKTSMEKGEWHTECERCKQEEKSGVLSRRQYENENWPNVKRNNPIDFIDIRYGNFCNMKCRMCGPSDSHMWYTDYVKLNGTTTYKDTHQVIELTQKDNGKYESDQYYWFKNYLEQFKKATEHVKKIYIAGGEPLIIEEHYTALERLIELDRAKDIHLEYNTNMTTIPDKVLALWEQFKKVSIGASIDGYGKVFEYQRPPGKWPSIYKNLQKVNDRNLNLWITYTVTVYNVFHLPEFMKWKLEESGLDNFNKHRLIVSHHICHTPKHTNIKVLPNMIKDELEDHYEEYIEWVKSSDHPKNVKKQFVKILNGVIKFMNSEDYSDHLNDFIDITNDLDKIRNHNVLDIVPEYEVIFR